MQIITQRRRPHEDRDDLSKTPFRSIDLVHIEPFQVRAEDVEAIDVQPEEDEMESRRPNTQDGAGVGKERSGGRDAQLSQYPVIEFPLVGVVRTTKVIHDDDEQSDEAEDKDIVSAATTASRIKAKVVAIIPRTVAPRDQILQLARSRSTRKCRWNDWVQIFWRWHEMSVFPHEGWRGYGYGDYWQSDDIPRQLLNHVKIEEGECDRKVASYGDDFDEDVCVVELLDSIGFDITDKTGNIRRQHKEALGFLEID